MDQNNESMSRRQIRRAENKMVKEAIQASLELSYDQEQEQIRKNYEELKNRPAEPIKKEDDEIDDYSSSESN